MPDEEQILCPIKHAAMCYLHKSSGLKNYERKESPQQLLTLLLK